MASRRLSIEIECGDTTCYDYEAHKMCPQVLTRRFGTEWVCGVFHRGGEAIVLRDVKNSLQRCSECKEAEVL